MDLNKVCNCELQALNLVLDKITTRVETYFGIDDFPMGASYVDGAIAELNGIKFYIRKLIMQIKWFHEDDKTCMSKDLLKDFEDGEKQ